MEHAKKEQAPVPPYVAYKTFTNFLRSLAQAIPSRIDKSVMTSMSGGTQYQIMQALKYLGLVSSGGTPTEKLPMLVKSEGAERQKVLREVLTAAYPFLGAKSFPLNDATMHQLEDEFKKLATGDTVRKCITFFIPAAKDAGIPLSPFIEKPGKRAPSNNRAKKRASASKPIAKVASLEFPTPPAQSLGWHELLLSKFPSFDPSWPDDVKTNWFKSFNELMQHGQKKEGQK